MNPTSSPSLSPSPDFFPVRTQEAFSRRAILVAGGAIVLLVATSGRPAFAAPDKSDVDFVTKAGGGGLYEVEVARLALTKAHGPDVRSYAQMLVDDHTKANGELKALAVAKAIPVPSEVPPEKRKVIERLAASKDFDKDWVEQVGKKDHDADIQLFEDASKNAKDADLRAFATKTLPTLRHHRQAADTLGKGGSGAPMPKA